MAQPRAPPTHPPTHPPTRSSRPSSWPAPIILAIAACLVAWFSHRQLTTYTIVLLPIGVQEMVLAGWLIAKGFSPPALQAGARFEQWRGND